MTAVVEFPAMRSEVVAAVRSLSDRAYQETRWGVVEPDVSSFDNLDLNVHVLYDDCAVLPDPLSRVGTVLLPNDVQGLARLHAAVGPMLVELGDVPDRRCLMDPRWDAVLEAAQEALVAMVPEDA